MASSLESPHWEASPPETRQLLEVIGTIPPCRRFYLGGGTALSLQLGHRMSRDFDFFSDVEDVRDETRSEILEHLRHSFPGLELVTDTLGDLTVAIAGRDVGFYSYRYLMLEAGSEVLNVKIAGLLDIASMKLDAIAGRGLRRDFYDLYFLAHRFSLEHIFERAQEKYPYARDYYMMIMPYLNDFTNADRDRAVTTLEPLDWEDVKTFFRAETKRLSQLWFLPPDK